MPNSDASSLETVSGPACRFDCKRKCRHAEFVPLVKRSAIKGRCRHLLRKRNTR